MILHACVKVNRKEVRFYGAKRTLPIWQKHREKTCRYEQKTTVVN